MEDFDNIAGFYGDFEKDELYIFRNNALKKQLQEKIPKINESFDSCYSQELDYLSEEISKLIAIQFGGIRRAEKSKIELQIVCANLYRNSINTLTTALQLTRSGYPVQSGTLLRSAIEICAAAIHLYLSPEKFEEFKKKEFKSTKSISFADNIIPAFGKIWGFLSNTQVHINVMHGNWHPVKFFEEKKESITSFNIGLIALSTIVLRASLERVYFKEIPMPEMWKLSETGEFIYIEPKKEKLVWIKNKMEGK